MCHNPFLCHFAKRRTPKGSTKSISRKLRLSGDASQGIEFTLTFSWKAPYKILNIALEAAPFL